MPDTLTTADQSRTTEHNTFEEIPQLVEEDWENGQFEDVDTNLIDQHNTQAESKRIWKEYSEQLLNLSDCIPYWIQTIMDQHQEDHTYIQIHAIWLATIPQ